MDEEHRDKHLESEHLMGGASSELGKSLVMLNRKFVWQDDGISYIETRDFVRELSTH